MVAILEPILSEFMEEAPATRRVLERIPADKLGWRPHAKSKSLGELAMHVAGLGGMVEKIASSDTFTPNPAALAKPPESVEEIRTAFEQNLQAAERALRGMTEETAQGSWAVVFGGKELFRKTRLKALRTNVLNHIYHHRGQLSVYLRLLEVPVPMVYGPTADENPFA